MPDMPQAPRFSSMPYSIYAEEIEYIGLRFEPRIKVLEQVRRRPPRPRLRTSLR